MKNNASKQGNVSLGVIGFIYEMLGELQNLAPGDAGPMLPYLIEMARIEAGERMPRLSDRSEAARSA